MDATLPWSPAVTACTDVSVEVGCLLLGIWSGGVSLFTVSVRLFVLQGVLLRLMALQETVVCYPCIVWMHYLRVLPPSPSKPHLTTLLTSAYKWLPVPHDD